MEDDSSYDDLTKIEEVESRLEEEKKSYVLDNIISFAGGKPNLEFEKQAYRSFAVN